MLLFDLFKGDWLILPDVYSVKAVVFEFLNQLTATEKLAFLLCWVLSSVLMGLIGERILKRFLLFFILTALFSPLVASLLLAWMCVGNIRSTSSAKALTRNGVRSSIETKKNPDLDKPRIVTDIRGYWLNGECFQTPEAAIAAFEQLLATSKEDLIPRDSELYK